MGADGNHQALPTVWSDTDANSLTWELMEIIKAHPAFAGEIAFDEANPASYSQAKEAILALIDQHFNQSGQTLIGNVLSAVSNSYLPIQNGTANNLQLAGDATTAMGAVTLQQLDGSINTLVNGAPGVLDQFNEVAAALGANPNFATDVLAALAGKISKTGAQGPLGDGRWYDFDALPNEYGFFAMTTDVAGGHPNLLNKPSWMTNSVDCLNFAYKNYQNIGFGAQLAIDCGGVVSTPTMGIRKLQGASGWSPWVNIGSASGGTGIITNPTIAYSDINSAATGDLLNCSLSIANGQITMHRTYAAGGGGVTPVNPVSPVTPVTVGGCVGVGM
jgi:hypothetical protein